MTETLVSTLAAVAIAGGARQPALYEKVCNYCFNNAVNFNRGVQTVADVGGVGAAFIAQGATTPYWLERIGNTVLTYPHTRSDSGVLAWPTS
jgi:hypothetical protein